MGVGNYTTLWVGWPGEGARWRGEVPLWGLHGSAPRAATAAAARGVAAASLVDDATAGICCSGAPA